LGAEYRPAEGCGLRTTEDSERDTVRQTKGMGK